MNKKMATWTTAGALLVGAAAGSTILGPALTKAASPTPTTSTQANPTTGGTFMGGPGMGGHGMGPGFGGRNEAVSDTSVVATAIGISEADLTAAIAKGQTIAAIAKAHNVDPQKAIDALVADGLDELAAAVKAGTITQAQADAQKADVTTRATGRVNGTFMGGPGMGPDGQH